MGTNSAEPACDRLLARRDVLKAGLVGAASLAALAVVRPASASADVVRDTVVVLSLRGGFDGISAVVPVADPHYYLARPGVAIPASETVYLDGHFGLHPSLGPLQTLWQGGTFAAIPAVGHPDRSRSHFQAIREMERAAIGTTTHTGWIDRFLSSAGSQPAFHTISLGSSAVPQSFIGPARELSLARPKDFRLWAADDKDPGESRRELDRWRNALTQMYRDSPTILREPAISALATVDRLRGVPEPSTAADYGDDELGHALADLAALIRGGVDVHLAAMEFGDWDMHEGMGTVAGGWLNDHLSVFARNVSAFFQDVAGHPVTLVTLSEFGRRVHQNDSEGVDHGHANTMLLFGSGVNGGRLHGRWPGVGPEHLDAGDVAQTSDYRDVLIEVLQKRAGLGDYSQVFPNHRYAEMGVCHRR
ncbi:MAG: DUF1501 domain-containing protein [Actinobacteria bacterium]|nr:DUF1501 domain-containing protein [Actinomycetota bacterium]